MKKGGAGATARCHTSAVKQREIRLKRLQRIDRDCAATPLRATGFAFAFSPRQGGFVFASPEKGLGLGPNAGAYFVKHFAGAVTARGPVARLVVRTNVDFPLRFVGAAAEAPGE